MNKKENKKWLMLLGAATGVFAGMAASVMVWKKKQKKTSRFHSELLASSDAAIGVIKFHRNRIGHHGEFQWKRFIVEQPTVIVILFLLILSIMFQSAIQKYSIFFQSSLLEIHHAKFNGTTIPVEKVPNWVILTAAERKMSYEQIPKSKLINTPEYNLSNMKAGITWKPNNELERNTFITYPVPYMGNYKLDGTENSGSHLGVDYKLPIGTPIHSIANGMVIKAENQSTGFGLHIVVAHVGIPDPDNAGKTTTLYSAYAHLSEMKVVVGQQVKKGEVIGYSGNTGMATAPHLHFQIDTKDAPFHPYWPFSWKDLQARSISSYFDGVKYGVGKDVALKYTVHPVNLSTELAHFTTEQSEDQLLVATAGTPDQHIQKEEEAVKTKKTKLTISDYIKPTSRRSHRTKKAEFKIGDRTFIPGKEKKINFWADDSTFEKSDTIEFSSTLGEMATVSPAFANKNDFINGGITLTIKTDSDSTFKVFATGSFGKIKSTSLKSEIFQDVSRSDKSFAAIKYLKDANIINGYKDGSFKPEGTLNRAETVKMLVEGFKIANKENKIAFSDIEGSEWFASFVKTAAANGLVKGYSDGKFRPDRTITKAEFLTIAIRAAKIETPKATESPYTDVPADSWFGSVFALAKEKKLITRSDTAKPHHPISRKEAAVIIFELVKAT